MYDSKSFIFLTIFNQILVIKISRSKTHYQTRSITTIRHIFRLQYIFKWTLLNLPLNQKIESGNMVRFEMELHTTKLQKLKMNLFLTLILQVFCLPKYSTLSKLIENYQNLVRFWSLFFHVSVGGCLFSREKAVKDVNSHVGFCFLVGVILNFHWSILTWPILIENNPD